MEIIQMIYNIYAQDEAVTKYAFRLFKKAKGDASTNYVGRGVHKIADDRLLKECYRRAETKYLRSKQCNATL